MKIISVFMILAILLCSTFLIKAQEEEACIPEEVVSSFAVAVAGDELDTWLDSYSESECADEIIEGANALADAYNNMIPTSNETLCAPAVGIVCELFAPAVQTTQTEGIESFVVVSPSNAELQDQFNDECAYTSLYGIEISYQSLSDGYSVWGVNWENSSAGLFDATEFENLVFWVRGAEGGEIFQIGIRDNSTEQKLESKQVTVVTDKWTKVTIPLSRYFDEIKSNQIVNINFGFNRDHDRGTICIDDVEFD